MSSKSYKEKPMKDYSIWFFVLLITTVVVSITTLIFAIKINNDVNKLTEDYVKVEGEPLTPEDVVATPDVEGTTLEEEHDHSSEPSLQVGGTYNGVFANELAGSGLELQEVLNLSDYMGTEFNGKVYTKETGVRMEQNLPTSITFKDLNLNVKDKDSFSALTSDCVESSDEMGNIYTLSENGEDYFFIRCISNEMPMGEGLDPLVCNVAYFCMKDYEKCKDLGVTIGNLHMDSTIADAISTFGQPTYLDIYEAEGESPYLMMYFSKLNEETFSVDELSLIFEYDELAPNGYRLSEVTVSVF